MTETAEIEMAFEEDVNHTEAQATLVLRGVRFTGFGRARRNPSDPNLPMVGEELAAARAQSDLIHKLVDAAAEATREWSCTKCSATGGDLLIMEDAGPVCLKCAHMDHLVFLPRGDAGLTRRVRKASPLSAVVVRKSRARQRYDRQGLLVEPAALEAAGGATGEP